MHRGVLAIGLLAGCFHPTPPGGAACNDNHECPTGLMCTAQNVCSISGDDGGIDGSPDAMVDACPVTHCEGAELIGCGATMTCANGCLSTGAPHCAALVPSNDVSVALLADVTAELTAAKYDFDTDTGQIKSANVTVRASGEGTISGIGFLLVDGNAVFTAQRFDLPANATWSVSGSNPLVLFSATTIVITGALSSGGNDENPGAGGTTGRDGSGTPSGCDGSDGSEASVGFGDGGGGAGGATPGGDGAVDIKGGGACALRPSTIPLRGGNAGGAAGVATTGTLTGGHGGGGGGAIMLVAMGSIAINSGGAVGTPGGGGESLPGASDGGGGGGGGGAVLIEAPSVTIAGSATANGGGGGAPSDGDDGSTGSVHTANPASGGTYMTGHGGSGGTSSAGPTDGVTFVDATPTARGGGGGGAVGRIEVKSVTSSLTGTISPAPLQTMAVLQ